MSSAEPIPPRQSRTKAAGLAAELRAEILANRLLPGSPLPSEADLISRTGLSRATVREAIRILDSEGFVDVRLGRNGGVRVSHPSPEVLGSWLATQLTLRAATVHSLIEFRRVVEPLAAELAATRATPEQLRLLQEVLKAPSMDDELDFHLFIADASHNELLKLLLRAVHSGLRDHDVYHRAASNEDATAGRRAHRRIFDAIVARDAAAAGAAMRKHLEAVERVVERTGRLDDVLVPPETWATL